MTQLVQAAQFVPLAPSDGIRRIGFIFVGLRSLFGVAPFQFFRRLFLVAGHANGKLFKRSAASRDLT